MLSAGATVALVAPSGPLRGEGDLARAEENVRSFGWEPVVGAHALDRAGYFAGSDRARLDDLNDALRGDADAIWFLRGGYGAMRLLDGLDFDAVRRRPRVFIGYSDITALHTAISARCDLVVFHGPTARSALTPFSRASLQRAVVTGENPCGAGDGATVVRPGHATGRLAGGNLALLSAIIGTPWAPDFDGALLVLEDINEPTYRVDRMMQQLRLAGALRGCRGIVFGHCTRCPEEADDGARSLVDVLAEHADALAVPCVSGVPVGHIADQWTIPLGATAELHAERDVVLDVAPSGGDGRRV